MGNPIGLIVQQIPAQAPPLVTPADVGILGVLSRSKRGILNEAVRFTNYQDYLNYVSLDPNDRNSLNIRNAFNEAGTFGLSVYSVRVGEESPTKYQTAKYLFSSQVNLVFQITPYALGLTGFDHLDITISAGVNGTYDITLDAKDNTNTSLSVPGNPETFNNVSKDVLIDTINSGLSGSKLAKIIFYSGTPITATLPITITLNNVNQVIGVNGLSSAINYNFYAGRLGKKDPGTWGNDYFIAMYPSDTHKPNISSLFVYVFDPITNNYVNVETITNLTTENWVSKINGLSNYICVIGNNDGDSMPYIPNITQLSGGQDQTTFVLNDYVNALSSFLGTPVTEIMALDVFSADWANMLDTFIKGNMADVVGLVNLPYGYTLSQISTTASASDTNLVADTKTFASLVQKENRVALYKGWGLVSAPNGANVWVPSIGAVYGAYYIRKMMTFGGLPYIAPGGSNVNITTLLKLDDTNGRYNATDLEFLVHTLGVNPLVNEPGLGIYVKTSRTPSTKNEFYDIHRQRSVGFLIRSFRKSLTFIEQEPHNIELRKKVVNTITIFMKTLYTAGMFDNTKGVSGAFLVKCDDQNNPPTLMEQRILVCEVAVKIVDTVETAYINIRSESRNLTVTGA